MDKTTNSSTAPTHPHHHRKPSAAAGGSGSKKIAKYFRRATTFTIPTRPYSPGHERGFSGPIVPLVPAAARRRSTDKSGGSCGGGGGDVVVEPTSPEVSCMGHVKRHKEEAMRMRSMKAELRREKKEKKEKKKEKKKESSPSSPSSSVLSKIFKGKFRHGAPPAPPPPASAPPLPPSIGQMRRFASGRDSLSGFNWKVNDIYGVRDGSYYSADEREEEEEEEYESSRISHSGPIVMGGERRKEVNLWQRRRAVEPPSPIRLSYG